jgi:type I restriction enzyme S subunit
MAEPLLDIRPDHLQIVLNILRKNTPHHEVWAFGSRAKWTAKDYSDLDLCIVSDQALSFQVLAALEEDFAESDLPWKVDVVDWATTSASFREIIERDKVMVQKPNNPNNVGRIRSGMTVTRQTSSDAAGYAGLNRPMTWPTAFLPEVVSFQEGPGILAKDFTSEGVPLVRLSGLGGYEVTLSGCNYVSNELGNSKWKHFQLRRGDILISTSASFGRPAVVGNEAEGAIFYTGVVRFRPISDTLDEGYLKLFLGSERFSQQAEAMASGSVIRHFGPSHLRQMFIDLPPIEFQKSIASVIGSLDDKIELNRQMNETLEATARLFFKDWFVDFGPTRAKAEGRPPYLAPELWGLFPDTLDDDDKPMGWKPARLGDIADGITRTVDPSDVEAETPYIGLEHMPRRSIALDSWEGAGKVTSGKLHFRRGELLFGKLRPYFHKVGIAPIDGICSTDIVVCKPKRETAYGLVLSLISSEEFVAYTDQTSTGTKMPRTSWSIMARYEITLPSAPIVEAFNNLLFPWIEMLCANIHENRTLAQTRDLLLPKLMSGEIRLREAEKMVNETL